VGRAPAARRAGRGMRLRAWRLGRGQRSAALRAAAGREGRGGTMRALGSRPGCSCAPRCCAPAPSAASSAAAWGRRWSWSRRRRRRSSGSRLPSGRALRLAKGGEAGWNSVRGARGHALCSHGQGEMHGLQRPASPSKRRTMGPSCEARRFAGHTDAPPSSPPPPSRTKWTRLVPLAGKRAVGGCARGAAGVARGADPQR